MMFTIAERVVARFKQADRGDDLVDEIQVLDDLAEDIEDIVFMEESATKLMHKAKELARKYPDLHDVAAKVERGIEDFHHHVLRELGSALDDLDEARQKRDFELDDIRANRH